MTPEPGDIVLVPFPYTDLAATKRRPALVLSRASFNAGPDVVVCAITSNLGNADRSVLLEAEDMAAGELKATSRIKIAKIVTLAQSMVVKTVGTVKPGIMAQVEKELVRLLLKD